MASEALPPQPALGPEVEIGIVGAGAMGAGIAQVTVVAGHRVRLFDVRPGAANSALDGIRKGIDKLVGKGRLSRQQGIVARDAVRAVDSLDELTSCGLVIEAIVEDLEAKRSLFRELEALVSDHALLTTNTSSLSITAIGAGLQHPERLAGLHFFNPAPVMPLVELISGVATSPQVTATLHSTAARWGKVPVLARSTPGFIVNRVARPFYAEALRVLQERGTDCATIDEIMRGSGGFRMGPFELMDLIGNDVNYAVTRSVFDAFYGDPRFTPSLLQLELVQAGFLGRKTGRGFYGYGEKSPSAQAVVYPPVEPSKGVCFYGEDDLIERLARGNIKSERRPAHTDGRVADCESCVLYRSDGRTATARAAANGVTNTVLIDLSFDAAAFTTAAIAPADGCVTAAVCSAAGLLQPSGLSVCVIDDIPGMVVLRTVAMLANEAADAVNQGVCSAADCDLAMRKGVNYPRGPLEWADRLSLRRVVDVLDHLSQAYGEDRYRVSPLLRRKALNCTRFMEETEVRHG